MNLSGIVSQRITGILKSLESAGDTSFGDSLWREKSLLTSSSDSFGTKEAQGSASVQPLKCFAL